MKTVKIGFEVEDDTAWIYLTRSFGRGKHAALDSPLHVILQWVIEQLSFGCWDPRYDENGEAVSLLLGKEAASDPIDEAQEFARKIRQFGNDIMHDARQPSDEEGWQALRQIRFMLEELCP